MTKANNLFLNISPKDIISKEVLQFVKGGLKKEDHQPPPPPSDPKDFFYNNVHFKNIFAVLRNIG